MSIQKFPKNVYFYITTYRTDQKNLYFDDPSRVFSTLYETLGIRSLLGIKFRIEGKYFYSSEILSKLKRLYDFIVD